jgi:hypothetical protein
MSFRTQCGILHTNVHSCFKRNKIQHIQCRCNAHCSCMMTLIIVNFVEYTCSQVVFSNSALNAFMVTEFSKILLPHHTVYLNYLKHLSAQGDFITYKHASLLFHTAHLTVNTQYYEISSHVAATALDVMWKYKYRRGVLRCNSDPPSIKFNL